MAKLGYKYWGLPQVQIQASYTKTPHRAFFVKSRITKARGDSSLTWLMKRDSNDSHVWYFQRKIAFFINSEGTHKAIYTTRLSCFLINLKVFTLLDTSGIISDN